MDKNSTFKAGFVSILGLPNAGKSTLLNSLTGYKLAITSPKPQTTRNKITGILNGKNYQAVFLDTPGFLNPHNLFEKSMLKSINTATFQDSDLICLITEPIMPNEKNLAYYEKLAKTNLPLFLIINKIDAFTKEQLLNANKAYSSLLKPEAAFEISALNGNGVKQLKDSIINRLPLSPAYYAPDEITTQWERFFAAEIIREQIFKLFKDEVPYLAAIEIDAFKEHSGFPDYIHANIHVSKKSAKPIIIGHRGKNLKTIRENAQKNMEKFINRKIKLELTVKITKDWQNDSVFLKNIGFYD
ncbi:MAG: GTPase Era [Elusimicrobia bacterium]|nr:GTPase Era [Elusimicrobiota bacterium]